MFTTFGETNIFDVSMTNTALPALSQLLAKLSVFEYITHFWCSIVSYNLFLSNLHLGNFPDF